MGIVATVPGNVPSLHGARKGTAYEIVVNGSNAA
jgi:hypothetical protein